MPEKKEMLEGKLADLQEEYSKTKDNKKTNKHLRILKAKIADTKREIVIASKHSKGEGYFIKKTGDATVALVGFPSTGKSTIINAIANTRSKTALYAFTTTTIIPGTMVYGDAHIQVFDMPGLIEGAHIGLGGARQVIAAMRTADLLVFVVDVNIPSTFDVLMSELASLNININREKPGVSIVENATGGVHIELNRSGLSDKVVQEIVSGLGRHNATVSITGRLSEDELIAIVSGRAYYMRAIVALNKIDSNAAYAEVAKSISSRYGGINVVPVSALNGGNIDKLKAAIYDSLGIITVYLKPKIGEERLMPMVLKRPATVADAARKFHTAIVDELKCAYITGPSARFQNQRVGAAHLLERGDVVTFIKNK